ncbi:C39 family peptidase [Butyrivibrio sp. FC2001]|uniref:C39 family peptidase n=1 Tax=Butyrivibrio sp. FC2001 TaxID=1280671 RepID=UPI00040401F9|nr:C39 family peptidase [Butyrivibrio sp. FC2001]
MVACGLKQDAKINPYVVGKYAAEQGLYTYGQGTSWDIMKTGAEHYGLTVSEGNISAEYIRDNLSDNTPMICSMKPGNFTYTGHFIVLTGIDEKGLVTVNDPNSPKNSSKKWDVDKLVSQMKSIWMYRL